MRAFARAALLLAGVHTAAIATPTLAWAQGPAPVPYDVPAPVQYGQPAPPNGAPPAPAPAPGPLPARPGASTQDTIYMKNGGILRGAIVDAIPGAQARIQLVTGEIATVPWSMIARIDHGQGAPAGPPPVVLPPQARTGTLVRVHVEGAEGGELQRRSGEDDEWTTVCSGPCDRALPIGSEYRIAGGGVRPSRPFHLAGSPGDQVNLEVTPAATGWFVLGIVIIPLGGATMLTGLMLLLASAVVGAANGNGDPTGADLTSAGWITFGLGTAALVGGVVLVVNNAHTNVVQDLGAARAAAVLGGDPWRKVPTWKEGRAEDKALPPVVGAPLWSMKF